MSLYNQLSGKYADIWEKNRNGHTLIVKILTQLKEMMADYLECSSGYLYFCPRDDISRKMYTAEQALKFKHSGDTHFGEIGLGISLFMGNNRRLPKAELIVPIQIYTEDQIILVLPHTKHPINLADKNTFLPLLQEVYRLIDEWITLVTDEKIQNLSYQQVIGFAPEKPEPEKF